MIAQIRIPLSLIWKVHGPKDKRMGQFFGENAFFPQLRGARVKSSRHLEADTILEL